MKIISVIGARPQFIKAAIVSRQLKKAGIEEKLIHTGQHYDFNMSEIFFRELEMQAPDYYLGIGSASHGEQTGRMLWEIEKILLKEKPSMVMVYGDTNSTLAGSLAASKLNIPTAHVEAGLRSFNRNMPEEANRILTDHVSDLLFSPTETGLQNLAREGVRNIIHAGGIIPPSPLPVPLAVNVGDVMFDIALAVKEIVDETIVLARHQLQRDDFILVTIHRAENTDKPEHLKGIWNALKQLAEQGKRICFPAHPRTKKLLGNYGLLQENLPPGLNISDPVSYMDMVVLEHSARVIITDSGGVQKEGFFFGTPCVIAREETEWVELVETGWNVLAGSCTGRLTTETHKFWENGAPRGDPPPAIFGHGNASEKIVRILSQ